jgi:magnesium chelatase family protein
VTVEPVAWKDLHGSRAPEDSGAIRERVRRARERAGARRPGVPGFRNADLTARELERHAALDGEGRRILETALTRLGLSVRAVHRGLRVARTIADLEESGAIAARHLAEALSYRAPALLSALPDGAG